MFLHIYYIYIYIYVIRLLKLILDDIIVVDDITVEKCPSSMSNSKCVNVFVLGLYSTSQPTLMEVHNINNN